jgi:hypothetical protein
MAIMLPPDDPRHGLNGYNNLDCRCPICRAANTEYQRDLRRRKANTLPLGDPRHGTLSGYTNYRCRCGQCRAARRAYRPVSA